MSVARTALVPTTRSASLRRRGRSPLRTTIAVVSLAAGLAGCGTAGGGDSEGEGVRLAAAIYPLEYVLTRVSGDHGTVETLTPPGAEPHDLELTVRQTAAVADADLVAYVAGFQPAIDEVVAQQASDTAVDVPFARRSFGQEESGHDHEEHEHDHGDGHGEDDHEGHEHDADHDHGDEDPHLWLDPLAMAAAADAYADRLAEIDPDNAADYTANAAAVVADLEALDAAYTDGLRECARDEVVVSHDAFGYLSRYGLQFSPIAGISPDAEPSPARLAELGDLIDDAGVTTVFTETLASPALAETLASELDISTAVLDPVEGLTDETADEDYLSLMEANLAALRQANDCA